MFNLKNWINEVTKSINILRGTSGRSGNQVTVSLGTLYTGAILTNGGTQLLFTIPTGRIFPNGTTVSSVRFYMVCRVSNSNASGVYIVKQTSGSASQVLVDSSQNSVIYNGNNVAKTILPSHWHFSLNGGTNVAINLNCSSSSTYFFSGTETINGYVNNQAATIALTSITITFNLPS